jgi:LPXTG-motif cell wall-anchored protein
MEAMETTALFAPKFWHTTCSSSLNDEGETMDTLLIVLLVVLLLGGGGWGYSRWRR